MNALQIKICGVTTEAEMRALDDAGVDYAGLWFDVPDGRRTLPRERLLELASIPTRGLRCVAVTTESEPATIAAFLRGARVSAVQAHGFLLPGALRRLRGLLGDGVEIFKVLHVKEGECLERSLLRRYAESGADAFVIDNFASRARIGSSGMGVPLSAIESIVDVVGPNQVFLAGGVDEAKIRDVSARFPLRGVDIDSAARVGDGIDRARVDSLVQFAHGAHRAGAAHAR